MSHPDGAALIRIARLSLALLGLVACAERGDDTLVFPSGQSTPEAVNVRPTTAIPITTIPENIQKEIKQHVTLYEGGSPPNIEGCYLISPMALSYSNLSEDVMGKIYTPTTVCFTRKLGNYLYSYKEREGTSRDSSDSVHVIGSGNTFTAYLTSVGISSEGISNKMAVVIAGVKTDAGITSISYTFTMLSKGYDPNGRLVRVGAIRSFKDSDGLAGKTTWGAARALQAWAGELVNASAGARR